MTPWSLQAPLAEACTLAGRGDGSNPQTQPQARPRLAQAGTGWRGLARPVFPSRTCAPLEAAGRSHGEPTRLPLSGKSGGHCVLSGFWVPRHPSPHQVSPPWERPLPQVRQKARATRPRPASSVSLGTRNRHARGSGCRESGRPALPRGKRFEESSVWPKKCRDKHPGGPWACPCHPGAIGPSVRHTHTHTPHACSAHGPSREGSLPVC